MLFSFSAPQYSYSIGNTIRVESFVVENGCRDPFEFECDHEQRMNPRDDKAVAQFKRVTEAPRNAV